MLCIDVSPSAMDDKKAGFGKDASGKPRLQCQDIGQPAGRVLALLPSNFKWPQSSFFALLRPVNAPVAFRISPQQSAGWLGGFPRTPVNRFAVTSEVDRLAVTREWK